MNHAPAFIRIYGPGFALAGLAMARPWLELTMARHMGLELPGLFVLGWIAARCDGDRLTQALASWNANGLPGLLFATCVAGFWMVPAALDSAVLHNGMAMGKVVSLVAAGLLAGASWSAAAPALLAFFVLNWFWMTLGAGLLYVETPQQLCSVYLPDQQVHAGQAMMLWATVGLGVWLAHVAQSCGDPPEPSS